jgi:hypothetical protein
VLSFLLICPRKSGNFALKRSATDPSLPKDVFFTTVLSVSKHIDHTLSVAMMGCLSMRWAVVMLSVAAQSSAFLHSHPASAPVVPKKLTTALCSQSEAWSSTTAAQRRAIVIAAPLVLFPSAKVMARDDVSRMKKICCIYPPRLPGQATYISCNNKKTTQFCLLNFTPTLERMRTVFELHPRASHSDAIFILERNGLRRKREILSFPVLHQKTRTSCTNKQELDNTT